MAYDPLDIQGQEHAREDSDQKLLVQAQQDAQDFKWIMANKRGRRYVWRLLDLAGVFRSSFTGNSQTFFNEGQRNIGLMVLAQIHKHCPEAYLLMLQEQKDHGRNNDQRASEH